MPHRIRRIPARLQIKKLVLTGNRTRTSPSRIETIAVKVVSNISEYLFHIEKNLLSQILNRNPDKNIGTSLLSKILLRRERKMQ